MGVRAACIDIGSNTTRLLVADCASGTLIEVHQERAFTRIGKGLAASGAIGADKIEEVVAVVLGQLAAARGLGAGEIRGVATAAIRTASNGVALVEAIAAGTGLEVEIVSGEDEARLAFRGAAAMLEPETAARCRQLGVIDVGGGSSEVVVGAAPDQVGWWASVPIGSGALTDHCLHSDPPGPAELESARHEVAAALAGLAPPCPEVAVAVGGSATSLGRVAGPVLDARRSSARSPCSRLNPPRRWPSVFSSTRNGRGCCPPACSSSRAPRGCWRRRSRSAGVASARACCSKRSERERRSGLG